MAGSFKFGTLAGYRGFEKDGRFSDEFEGLYSYEYFNRGDLLDARIGTNVFKGNRLSPGSFCFQDRREFNCWVSCFFDGPFDARAQHIFRFGGWVEGGPRYSGDHRLTCWVTYDGDKLYSAFECLLPRRVRNPELKFLRGAVSYGSKSRAMPSLGPYDQREVTEAPTLKEAAYSKPNRFRIEREFRICAFVDSAGDQKYSDLIWAHEAFLSCVLDYGFGDDVT